jgi:hypothetical protein
MSTATPQVATTFNIKVESYPNWDTSPEKRLDSVRCSLKHYGFRRIHGTSQAGQLALSSPNVGRTHGEP